MQRAATVINSVQEGAFENLIVNGPMAITEETGLTSTTSSLLPLDDLRRESAADRATTVGFCTLRNEEEWTENGLCSSAVEKCMVCSNAIVFKQHLPQLLLLKLHLEGLRDRCTAEDFLARFGPSLENIESILGSFDAKAVSEAQALLSGQKETLIIPTNMR